MFLFARCLHLLVKIFIKVKNGLMMNPGVENRSICVWLLYCVINFCRFVSPLISQLSGSQILNYLPPRVKNSCESTTSPLISQLNDSVQWTMHILNRLANLPSFPTFFRNQQAVVGNLLKILVDLFWPLTSVLLDARERKGRLWRRTWSISWHLHSRITSKWRHLANKNI